MTHLKTSLTDLPTDILLTIFPHLEARDFLALCSSTKALNAFHFDPTYWRLLTRNTFRLPNQPLLQADGARWQWLYKRLRTQTKAFTWGSNDNYCLGQRVLTEDEISSDPPDVRLRRVIASRKVSWPMEMQGIQRVGIVADLQCGGWSTTLLNSTGQLYAVGTLNGLRSPHGAVPELQRLQFPPGYAHGSRERYEPTTAIKQYSCGRMHILGLADSGKIWQWDDIDRDARHIKFLHTDLLENSPTGGHGTVTRVVAGWDRATAYIVGTGIVFWDPNLVVGQHDEAVDGVLIDPITIPATAYRKRRVERQSTLEAGDNVGEVINHIVLEGYIVFITDLNKTFAVKSSFPDDESLELVELTTISDLLGAGPSNIQDIQGSFRNFAIFTTTGEVFTADRQFLDAFWENKSSDQAVEQLPKPARIPALQHTGVISMAFGDYHYHALHSDGQLSSYGTEPQWCGALGLGSRFDGSMLRGFRYQNHWGGDGTVSPHGYSSGHRIWFEPEKKLWLAHMKEATRSPEAVRRVTMAFQSEEVNADMAEWFEQEGRGWDDFEDLNDPNEPVLGAYFVLSVAAAGWHSGALVLVDEKRAAMVRERYLVKPNSVSTAEAVDDRYEQQSMIASLIGWLYRMGRSFLGLDAHIGQHEERWPAFESAEGRPSGDVKYIWHNQPFPRIRLSTGEEMPGDVPLSEWRYGVPDRRIRNTERP